MPMQRWMQSAAGGTSQRLKPALAIVCSRSRTPSPPLIVPAVSAVAIHASLQPPALGVPAAYDSVVPSDAAHTALLLCTIFALRQDQTRIRDPSCDGFMPAPSRAAEGIKPDLRVSEPQLNLRVLAGNANWDRCYTSCR